MYRSERKNIQMYESRIIVNTHKLQDIYRAHILSKKKKLAYGMNFRIFCITHNMFVKVAYKNSKTFVSLFIRFSLINVK